jgi:hypothetical protein
MGFPRDVVLAIDASGSMGTNGNCGGNPQNPAIEPTREAAAEFVRDLAVSTLNERAGVVSFASVAQVRSPIVGLHDPGQPLRLIVQTMAIEAQPCGEDGGTNTGGAIEQAIELFDEDEGPGGVAFHPRMMVVLSDGLANRGRHGEDTYGNEGDPRNPAWLYAVEEAREAHDQGIIVHTITLGNAGQREQMEEIAEVGGGMSLVAPTPEDLDRMFEILARVVQVALVD